MSAHSGLRSLNVPSVTSNARSPVPFAIIKEEQNSPSVSALFGDRKREEENVEQQPERIRNPDIEAGEPIPRVRMECANCNCADHQPTLIQQIIQQPNTAEIERLMDEREEELRQEFQQTLEQNVELMKDRFDFILRHEEIRTALLLDEARREKAEKLKALRSQLECKNLAGLIYVLCVERNKNKAEKLQIVEEYTTYIKTLQEILSEGQDLILHLSRGYKTAAMVDHEWREKMKSLLKEFKDFILHFSGERPDLTQYLFDMEDLMNVNAPKEIDQNMDPCEKPSRSESIEPSPFASPVESIEDDYSIPHWWDRLDTEDRPFVMFGDMSGFNNTERKKTVRACKAAKTAPSRWKEYVFHDMFIDDHCSNVNKYKDDYLRSHTVAADKNFVCKNFGEGKSSKEGSASSQLNGVQEYVRGAAMSVDVRGNMGSILKIIANVVPNGRPVSVTPKATILAAKDSMEIVSNTRLREKSHMNTSKLKQAGNKERLTINLGHRNLSLLNDLHEEDEKRMRQRVPSSKQMHTTLDEDAEVSGVQINALGKHCIDSLTVMPHHIPDIDSQLVFKKVCPVRRCNAQRMDSFMNSLPSYMRTGSYAHFDQKYEHYETCTAEQLGILKQRIERHKKKKTEESKDIDMNKEWYTPPPGVAVQTSDVLISEEYNLPCTCRNPPPTRIASETGKVADVLDLLPMKKQIDHVTTECLYDKDIEFNRFKVLGQIDEDDVIRRKLEPKQGDAVRLNGIRKILQQHPSLLDIFQANTKC